MGGVNIRRLQIGFKCCLRFNKIQLYKVILCAWGPSTCPSPPRHRLGTPGLRLLGRACVQAGGRQATVPTEDRAALRHWERALSTDCVWTPVLTDGDAVSPLPSAPPPPFTPHRGPRGCSRSRVPAASETQPCPWEADIQEGDRPETNQTIKQDRSHGLEKQRGQEGREAGRTGLSWDQVSRRFQRAACRRRRTSGHLSRWREDMGREGGHARVPRRAQDPEPREGAGGRGPCWSRTGRAS